MKRKIITSVILMLILGYITDTFPQISQGGKPYSFTHQLPSSIETKVMPPFDVETLLREDADTRKDVPYRFGYGFDVSYNLQNSGTWEKLPNGNKLWRLKILSKDAYSINLLYDKFWFRAQRFHIKIPKDGFVILKIFDMLGREIQTLVNKFQTKGKYNINFNASNLASGIYFYQLIINDGKFTNNDFSSIKKLILLR